MEELRVVELCKQIRVGHTFRCFIQIVFNGCQRRFRLKQSISYFQGAKQKQNTAR